VVARPRDWRSGLDVTGYWWPHDGEAPLPDVLRDFIEAGPPPFRTNNCGMNHLRKVVLILELFCSIVFKKEPIIVDFEISLSFVWHMSVTAKDRRTGDSYYRKNVKTLQTRLIILK
jgi:hypothetical protein